MNLQFKTQLLAPTDHSVNYDLASSVGRGFPLRCSMIIYKVTNLINGKVYIGQTVKTLERRKSTHIACAKRGSGIYLHRAIRKYGINNFKWQVICICSNIDFLNEQEQYYIVYYSSFNNGYNLTTGGGGMAGFKLSEGSKKKMSATRIELELSKGENNPMYGKRGEDSSHYGKSHSDETKEKMSKASSGKNNHFYGKHHSNKSKEKMRQAKLGEKNNMYGLHFSDESKEKMRQNRLKYWAKRSV